MELLRNSVTRAIQQLQNGSTWANVFDVISIASGDRKEAEEFEEMRPPFMFLGSLYGMSYVDCLLRSPVCSGYLIFIPRTWIKTLPLDTLKYLIGHEIAHVMFNVNRMLHFNKIMDSFTENLEESMCDVFGFLLSDVMTFEDLYSSYESGLKVHLPREEHKEIAHYLEESEMAERLVFAYKVLSDTKFCLSEDAKDCLATIGRCWQYIIDTGLGKH
jgi:hypothetical protein